MAHQNYRPDYDYLKRLGFVETNDGENHPYDREHSLDFGKDAFLICDAFWDFRIEVEGFCEISVLFFDNDSLEAFIKRFNYKNT